MNNRLRQIISFCIAGIWLVNGLYCKVLNFVPRHETIVSVILGIDNARGLTIFIGLSEILMGIWILTGHQKKLNVFVQVLAIVCMNLLEFFLAPELLLWGKYNSLFALLLILVILANEFWENKDNLIEA